MVTFRKYYNWLILPALLIIFFALFSGFSNGSDEAAVEAALRERTEIMQDCFYGVISLENAERRLEEIETYPMLTEDIRSLREWESTQLDMVKKMTFHKIEKKREVLSYGTYNVEICWDMAGLSEDYTLTGTYHTVVKKAKDKIFLSKFEPIE